MAAVWFPYPATPHSGAPKITSHISIPQFSQFTMEEAIPVASLTNQIQEYHMCNIPDVQKNVNFIMEHLNDPNFNLSHPPSFTSDIAEEPTRINDQDGNEAIYFDKSDLFYPPPISPF